MKQVDFSLWEALVREGTGSAVGSLSALVGRDIGLASFGMREIPVQDVVNLMGGPEVPALGVYLSFSGSAEGHIMLMCEPKVSYVIADLMLGQPPGSTNLLGDLERSALGELGNICGSAFLNAIANGASLRLMPSPPTVVSDMAGALLEVIAADLFATQDGAFVAEAAFRTVQGEVAGSFFVMPGFDLMLAVAENAARMEPAA